MTPVFWPPKIAVCKQRINTRERLFEMRFEFLLSLLVGGSAPVLAPLFFRYIK